MTADVVSVRQNLNLLVDGGHPVAGLNAADTTQWVRRSGTRSTSGGPVSG